MGRHFSSSCPMKKQSIDTCGISCEASASILLCASLLPRPRTQCLHHDLYGICVSSCLILSSREGSTCARFLDFTAADTTSPSDWSVGLTATGGLACENLMRKMLLLGCLPLAPSRELNLSAHQCCKLPYPLQLAAILPLSSLGFHLSN